jgi:hypothetical protein
LHRCCTLIPERVERLCLLGCISVDQRLWLSAGSVVFDQSLVTSAATKRDQFGLSYLDGCYHKLAEHAGAAAEAIKGNIGQLVRETRLAYWRKQYPAHSGIQFIPGDADRPAVVLWVDANGILWLRPYATRQRQSRNLTVEFGLPLIGGGMHANPQGELVYTTATGQIIRVTEVTGRPV